MASLSHEKRAGESSTQDLMSSRSAAYDTQQTDANLDNPFATPGTQTPNANAQGFESRAESETGSSGSTSGYQYFTPGVYFRSRRIQKGQVERPWLQNKDPREKWMTIIPLVGLFLGLGVVGVLIWDGVRSVAQHHYCPVLDEDFASWNDNIWSKEVEVGGYG
jgi:hypothetical protein